MSLGYLAPGLHYLQVLREDHGGFTDFNILVTAELAAATQLLAPGTLPMLAFGLALMGMTVRARRRNARP